MKSVAMTTAPQLETTLTVMNGSQKGTVYRVVSNRVTIGRGSDNDIVVDDPKCSRHHAEIFLGTHGFEIRDLSERNVMLVDGREAKAAPLRESSTFVLGLTQFRFAMRANQLQSQSTATHEGLTLVSAQTGMAPAMGAGTSPSIRRPNPVKKSGGLNPVRLIMIVLAIGVVYILMDNGPKKPAGPTPEQLAEQEMKAAETVKQSAESRYRPKDVSINDIGYKQAQQAFVEGFRDFRKGQYERALQAFQACLSLYPNHVMCNRYQRLTQRKFDEIIQLQMVLGREYRDQNQFSACASAFRNVMVMIKDSTNKRYIEAQANYKACQEHVEERY